MPARPSFQKLWDNFPTHSQPRTIKDADGRPIMFDVNSFRSYLRRAWGEPLVDTEMPLDGAFQGKRGVIAFKVNWSNATGHITLWNGRAYREPNHDDFSRYVDRDDPSIHTTRSELWELR